MPDGAMKIPVRCGGEKNISALITDDGAAESDLEPIRRAGVNVIVARVEAGDTRAAAAGVTPAR